MPHIGDRVEVFWPDNDKFYPGTISSRTDDCKFQVANADGDRKNLDFNIEKWRFESNGS